MGVGSVCAIVASPLGLSGGAGSGLAVRLREVRAELSLMILLLVAVDAVDLRGPPTAVQRLLAHQRRHSAVEYLVAPNPCSSRVLQLGVVWLACLYLYLLSVVRAGTEV